MFRCCKSCGAILDDDANVCACCGTVSQDASVNIPVKEAPAPTSTKRLSKKTLLISCGVLLVTVIAIVILLISKRSIEPIPAVAWYEDVRHGNCEHLENLAPSEYWNAMAQKYHIPADEYIAHQKQRLATPAYADQEIDLVDCEAVEADILNNIRNSLEKTLHIAPNRVQAAQRLIITFESPSGISAYEITAVKIDSEWYLINEDSYPFFFIHGLTETWLYG